MNLGIGHNRPSDSYELRAFRAWWMDYCKAMYPDYGCLVGRALRKHCDAPHITELVAIANAAWNAAVRDVQEEDTSDRPV